MAEGINVRLTDKLRSFVESRTGENGLYGSASEYIRDLIRRDYEQEEAYKWKQLLSELQPGLEADEDDFVIFDPEDIITEAKGEQCVGFL